ncbi:hypothetical protein AB1N83_008905 [Pleurotus pulmonarius]
MPVLDRPYVECCHPPGGRNICLSIDGVFEPSERKNSIILEFHNRIVQDDSECYALKDRSKPPIYHVISMPITWDLQRALFEAYVWLCRTYIPGDRIFLLGFSRGSFVVRVLAEVIERLGILYEKCTYVVDLVQILLELYLETRTGTEMCYCTMVKIGLSHANAKVHFVGVWDTTSFQDIGSGSGVPETSGGMEHEMWFEGSHFDLGSGKHPNQVAGRWQFLAILPLRAQNTRRRRATRQTDRARSQEHIPASRVILQGHRVHGSVLEALRSSIYIPAARFQNGTTWDDLARISSITEADPFASAISMFASMSTTLYRDSLSELLTPHASHTQIDLFSISSASSQSHTSVENFILSRPASRASSSGSFNSLLDLYLSVPALSPILYDGDNGTSLAIPGSESQAVNIAISVNQITITPSADSALLGRAITFKGDACTININYNVTFMGDNFNGPILGGNIGGRNNVNQVAYGI